MVFIVLKMIFGGFLLLKTLNYQIIIFGVLVVDSEDKKWIGTKNGLVAITDEGWQLFNKKNSLLKSNRINSIVCDDYDRIWVSTEKGVISYDGDSWEKQKTKICKKEVITSLFIDAFDNKWICTLNNIILFNTEG